MPPPKASAATSGSAAPGSGARRRSMPVERQVGAERVQHGERRSAGRWSASPRRPRPSRAGPGESVVSPRRPRGLDGAARGRTRTPAKRARTAAAASPSPSTASATSLEDLALVRIGRPHVACVAVEWRVGRPEQQHPLPRNQRTPRAPGRPGSSTRRPNPRGARARGARPCSASPTCLPRRPRAAARRRPTAPSR